MNRYPRVGTVSMIFESLLLSPSSRLRIAIVRVSVFSSTKLLGQTLSSSSRLSTRCPARLTNNVSTRKAFGSSAMRCPLRLRQNSPSLSSKSRKR